MNRSIRIRVRVLSGVFCLGLIAVGLRAGCLQLSPNERLAELSARQSHREVQIPSTRGDILDRHGKLLAGSVDTFSIFAEPRRIDPNLARSHAEELARITGEPFRTLYQRLVSDRSFVWLARQRSPEVRDMVLALRFAGVGVRKEPKRYYPERELAAHLLGFTNVDGHGLEGIERRFNDLLAGAPKSVEVMRDALGRYLLFDDASRDTLIKGQSVRLTLDSAIQHSAEMALRDAMKQFDAVSGVAVVLGVEDASVLAMAVEPHFNPNEVGGSDAATRRNRAVTDVFEPGSTLKPFVIGRALDRGTVAENAIIFCENGQLEIDGHTIRDGKGYGWLGLDTIIQKSSNIGAIRVGQSLGRRELGRLLSDLGFGRRTGIELPGETAGIVRNHESWSDVGLANISFGHGVAVSALQLAAGYRTLAADGEYLEPRLVDAVIGPAGESAPPPRESRRVFSRGAVARLRRALQLATGPGGTGTRAQIEGYAVAGKTGTAQKVDRISGGYSNEAFISVFAGFVPADDPSVVIVVAIDDPKPVHGGGAVAAPVFSQIARETMRELGRVPDDSLIPSAEVVEVVPEEAASALPSGHEAALQAALAAAKGGTPSFIGMTAHQAVERYARASLRVPLSIEGSGVVVAQKPGPGQPVQGGLVLTLAAPGESR